MKPHYVVTDTPCWKQLDRNKECVNAMLETAHECYKQGHYDAAENILTDIDLRITLIQLQQLYLNPVDEQKSHKHYCGLHEDIVSNRQLIAEKRKKKVSDSSDS